jgi:alanine dehydrogenase
MRIAKHGAVETSRMDPGFAKGVNVMDGKITCQPVSEFFKLPYTPLSALIG